MKETLNKGTINLTKQQLESLKKLEGNSQFRLLMEYLNSTFEVDMGNLLLLGEPNDEVIMSRIRDLRGYFKIIRRIEDLVGGADDRLQKLEKQIND